MLSEEQPLMFEHVLFFCTGMDRIRPYGLTQKIVNSNIIAVNFGGDFGKI